jgi:hypothetical protein
MRIIVLSGQFLFHENLLNAAVALLLSKFFSINNKINNFRGRVVEGTLFEIV